jgi:hypothetical protein
VRYVHESRQEDVRSTRRILLGVLLLPPYLYLLAILWNYVGGWTFVPWVVGGWFLFKGIDQITRKRD